MTDDDAPRSSIILYQAEDGRTRIQCRFEDETIWLTQALIAELFQKDVRTVNEHLANIYDEGEVARAATIRNFRIVRFEGVREVAREIEHYSLPTILAVGYRVRSPRGAQFRQWATARLSEYLLKGFSIDDQPVEGEVEAGKLYTESHVNRIIEIKEREKKRVEIFMSQIDQREGGDKHTLQHEATGVPGLRPRPLRERGRGGFGPGKAHAPPAPEVPRLHHGRRC